MPATAIGIGLCLIAVGLGGYLSTGRDSATALIPAVIGLILVILGFLASRGVSRKVVMHIAVVVGLLGFIGAPMRPVMKSFKGEIVEWASTPVILQLVTSGLCLLFVILCVRSFINARRAQA